MNQHLVRIAGLAAAGCVAAVAAGAAGAETVAAVFRCVEQGVVVYRGESCGDRGERVVLTIPRGLGMARSAGDPDPLARLRQRVDAMARERRRDEIDATVAMLEARRAELDAPAAAERALLNTEYTFAFCNLYLEPYQLTGIRQDVERRQAAVSAAYVQRQARLRSMIGALQDEAATLVAQR